MPDADMETTVRIMSDSAFGCAGQRCLSRLGRHPRGRGARRLRRGHLRAASSRKVGYGMDEGVQMGPVITPQSKDRIAGLIEKGAQEGRTYW